MRFRTHTVIVQDVEISDDPEIYEGAKTPRDRVAKHKQYIEEDGEYFIAMLNDAPSEMQTVGVTPIYHVNEMEPVERAKWLWEIHTTYPSMIGEVVLVEQEDGTINYHRVAKVIPHMQDQEFSLMIAKDVADISVSDIRSKLNKL